MRVQLTHGVVCVFMSCAVIGSLGCSEPAAVCSQDCGVQSLDASLPDASLPDASVDAISDDAFPDAQDATVTDARLDAAVRDAAVRDASLDASDDAMMMMSCVIDRDCDDADACTVDDCVGGYCQRMPRECVASSRCQTSMCDSVQGCVVSTTPDCPAPPSAPPGCAAMTTTISRTPMLPISTSATAYDQFTPGMVLGSYLWNISVTTGIRHSFSGDAHIGINGVMLAQGGAGDFDDVYDGTRWDDRADLLVGSYPYVDGVTATPLTPVASLSAFRGIDPNRRWSITISNSGALIPPESGQLLSWSLTFTTLDVSPSLTSAMFGSAGPTEIRDMMSLSSPLVVSGAPTFICNVEVEHDLVHAAHRQLALNLISPAGTRVVLSNRHGVPTGEHAALRWSDQGGRSIGYDRFWELRTGMGLVPVGAFGALVGEDPNGTWYLEVQDQVAESEGMLRSWNLHLTTCTCL